MAKGQEEREWILQYNLQDIIGRAKELGDNDVLLLLDLNDTLARGLFASIRMGEGISKADAEQEINACRLQVGPDFCATAWIGMPYGCARGCLAITSGTTENFDYAWNKRKPGQHVVGIMAANGNLYTVI